MIDNSKTIDLAGLLKLKKEDISKKQAIEIEYLGRALQSIAKRQYYCYFHYDECMKTHPQDILWEDKVFSNNINPEQSARISYEANALAFLQNLHALFDSFPFILNLLFRKIEEFNSYKIAWNDDFLKKFKKDIFYQQLICFSENLTFCQLKGYTNTTKHKHLIRIKNQNKTLVFENFTYKLKGEVKEVKNMDVNMFLTDCYDVLFPLFIDLFNVIKHEKEREISNN